MNYHNKIFIATEFFSSSQNSTGYFWDKLIHKFESEGWIVNLIAPYYGDVEINEGAKSVIYDFFKINKKKGDGFLVRLLIQLYIVFKFLKKIIFRKNTGELFLTGTNPALLLFFMPLLKKMKKIKWILLVHDVYPDNLVAAGFIKRNNLIYKIFYKYYLFVYASADKIFVIGRDMRENIEGKVKDRNRIFYVPNWVGSEDISVINKKDSLILKELGWEDKKVFQFFGNFGKLQGLNNIIAAINKIDRDDICFLFIGDGTERGLIEEFIKNNKNGNIFYYGSLSEDMRSEGLAACDFAIVSLSAGMLGLGVPSKAYFTMAADRRILGVMDEKSEIALTVCENNIGVIVPPGDPDRLAVEILELCDCFDSYKFSSPRDVFLNNFNEKYLLDKFLLNIVE